MQQWLKTIEREVTPVTARNHLKRLTGAFAEATRNRFIEHNPCISVSAPKDRNPPEKHTFSNRQIEGLLKVADSEWKGMILVGYYCGLRLGDAATLRWKDVDLAQNWISVFPEKTRHLGKKVKIPIHPTLHEYLLSLEGQDDPEAYLFPILARKKVPGQSGLSLRFADLVTRAGIQNTLLRPETKALARSRRVRGLTYHSLRHSAISALANEGVPEEVRMKISAHSDKKVHRGYTHFEERALRDAVTKLPKLNF
ncbi:MAG: site-specific integrase [Chitinophagia bacterium]|nr:site-specific integrase [Chitinophagia bacterium]